ncbi:FAD-binding oxidoreductase [Streptomyces sp. NPDC051985]|uniref:FAD-binding oxidoreductase n=1 Tax=Streptomyces sp. NPDC051985 TaxID=3155807 RepID=UPI00341F52CF
MADTSIHARPDILRGRTVWRDSPDYEQTRRDLVWNGYKPERYPAVIVRPRDAAEAATAVRFAADRGMRVKARSGGHNWTASFLRDEAMVIDLGDLTGVDLDTEAHTISVGPAVEGAVLQRLLRPHGLFFPTGHCSDVALGGYLLQGGWGWNVPRLGLANSLLASLEVVTAAGEVLTASPLENSDLYWAARGAGAGFPGIVTRYDLRLLPLPAMRVSQSLYRREDLPAVLKWATEIGQQLPHDIEMNVFVMRDLEKIVPGGFAFLNLASLAPTDEHAAEVLRGVDTCPVRDRALLHRVAEPSSVAEMYEFTDRVYVKGLRFGADNMFSDAPPERITAAVLAMAEDLPTPESHVLWFPYPLERVRTDTSMALMATNYLVGYGATPDPDQDEAVQSWAPRHMRAFESFAVGMQLGDENLAARPHATILKAGAEARLEEVRRRRDSEGVFLSYYRG